MLHDFGIPFKRLPKELPIFPLPGVLLLPGGRLPLNVFETRYLNMVIDALGEERLIGMVQTPEVVADLIPDDAQLFLSLIHI